MKQRNRLLFLLVFALAFVVRVAWIDRFPPGLWMDEGLNGVNAWRTIHGGGFRLTYPDIFPQMPLLMWLLAVVFATTGPSVLVMRLVMVTIGSLTCAVFLGAVLSVESRRGRALALCAAFVLATLHWHSHFSRLVFPTLCVPLVACALVWAMAAAARFKASSARRKGAWAAAGLVVGLGFYTYYSWYFFLPVIAVWFWALRPGPADSPASTPPPARWPGDLLYFAAGAGFAVLPLLVHYILVPGDLTKRVEALSLFDRGLGAGLGAMAVNLRDVALMFFIRGDHVTKHNVAVPMSPGDLLYGKTGTPVFEPVWALLFLAGLVRAILDLRRRDGCARRSAAWLVWLACMSMPSVASKTDSANSLRNLGATPAVAWLVALGWSWGCELARERFVAERWRRLAHGVLIAALVWGAGYQVYKAWWLHPRVPGIARDFSAFHIGFVRLCEPDPNRAVYFVPTDFYRHKTFEFLTLKRTDIRPLDPVAVLAREPDGAARDHIVVCTALSPNGAILRRRFPNATMGERYVATDSPEGNVPFAGTLRIAARDLLTPEEA